MAIFEECSDRDVRESPRYVLPAHTLVGHRFSWDCAISHDGSTGVSTCDDIGLVWDPRSGIMTAMLSGHKKGIIRCLLSEKGHVAVTLSHDDTLRFWGTELGTLRKTQLLNKMGTPQSFAITSDARSAFVTFGAPANAIVRYNTGARNLFISWIHTWNVQAQACAVSNGGDIVAVSVRRPGGGGGVRILDGSNGRILRVWHCAEYANVAVDGGGKYVMIADDNRLRVLDIQHAEKQAFVLEGYFGGAYAHSTMSSDGRRVVARYRTRNTEDPTFAVWDISSGAVIAILVGHAGATTHCAISGDGECVLTTGTDCTARIWYLTNSGRARERAIWATSYAGRIHRAREVFKLATRGKHDSLNLADAYKQIIALLSSGGFGLPSYVDVDKLMRQAATRRPDRLHEDEFALLLDAVLNRPLSRT